MLDSLVGIIFDTICGGIGHHFVKFVTLGRVDLDWGEGSGSVLAQWVGVFVLVGLGVIVGTFAL